MASRRTAPPPAAPNVLAAPGFRLQVALPTGCRHVPLAGVLRLSAEGLVAEGLTPEGLPPEGRAAAAVEVREAQGRVTARPLVEGAGVRLNEVQLTAPAQLRSGDQLALGECRVTLVRQSPPPARRGAPRPAWQLEPWLEDAVAAAARSGTPFLLAELRETPPPEAPPDGRPPGALFTLGQGLLAARWQPEPPPGAVRWARFPDGGAHAAALLGRVLGAEEGGGGEESPVVREPVMVRLSGLLEQLAALALPVLLEGEPGVGRALWARRLLALRGEGDWWEVRGGERDAAARLAQAAGRALLVEDVHLLRPELQEALAAHTGPLVATAALLEGAEEDGAAGGLRPALAARFTGGRLLVPPLRDRPAELPALVEAELVRLRERLGRPGLQLDPQARALVLGDAWPGNVDALKAALWRAARLATGESVRPEDLPLRLGAAAPRLGVAAARAVAERSALLAALAEAGWNVSEAARRMGLPRRTVVHRTSVLGVRRPARR